jgi:hypothetical protein
MSKLCTNENHSYKHNEQINNQNINNSGLHVAILLAEYCISVPDEGYS